MSFGCKVTVCAVDGIPVCAGSNTAICAASLFAFSDAGEGAFNDAWVGLVSSVGLLAGNWPSSINRECRRREFSFSCNCIWNRKDNNEGELESVGE